MLHKYEHTKHERLRSWRRFQEERVVKHRLKTNDQFYGWEYESFETGGVSYGRATWVDLLGEKCSQRLRTSFSWYKSRWDWDKKYNRVKNKKYKKRLLWEEGIY